MVVYEWSRVAEEALNPLVSRQMIHTERMTVARLRLRKGALVPEHSHMHEQVTMLIEGQVRFTVGGEVRILSAGELMQIPPHAPHSVEALADSMAIDLFSPVRDDWVRGDDAYLRR
jgi:quercetin dioxygenase-like cupin family protein